MNPFIKKIAVYASIAAIIFAVVFVERKPILGVFNFVKDYSSRNEAVLKEFRKEIFSSPLKNKSDNSAASLSPSNIIDLTNQEREKAGLKKLGGNSLLDKAAMLKVQDIFNFQYFDHISPNGNGPGYLADLAGYSYVIIGENLALGTFDSDASLVKAWMDSEGHRENILNERYREIGVAVGQGMFKGERVFVAVQEFGKPTSDCPSASSEDRARIDNYKAEAEKMSSLLNNLKNSLNTAPNSTSEEKSAYNEKVSEYNATVSKYNSLVEILRSEIDAYNKRVREFNECAKK